MKVGAAADTARIANARGPKPTIAGMTVEEYGDKWIAGRKHRVASVRDEQGQLVNHVNPRIGAMLVREVKPRHIRDFILDLSSANIRKRGTGRRRGRRRKIAPRTIAACIRDAAPDVQVGGHRRGDRSSNPVVVEKGVLPKNVDKDPSWRATAVFESGARWSR